MLLIGFLNFIQDHSSNNYKYFSELLFSDVCVLQNRFHKSGKYCFFDSQDIVFSNNQSILGLPYHVDFIKLLNYKNPIIDKYNIDSNYINAIEEKVAKSIQTYLDLYNDSQLDDVESQFSSFFINWLSQSICMTHNAKIIDVNIFGNKLRPLLIKKTSILLNDISKKESATKVACALEGLVDILSTLYKRDQRLEEEMPENIKQSLLWLSNIDGKLQVGGFLNILTKKTIVSLEQALHRM